MAAQPAVSVSGGPGPKSFETVARCVRGITRAVLMAAAALFCIALGGLAVDIIMRYSVNSSVRGMQEIVNLLFGWIYMLGVAALYARKGDAAITFVVRSMPPKLQNVMAIVVSLLIAASMAIVFFATCSLIQAQASITSAELGIPEPLRFMPLALAAASIVVTSLIEVWACVIWMSTGTRPAIWHDTDD